MNKRLAVGVCLLVVIVWLLAGHAEMWQVRANEYFGDGTMLIVLQWDDIDGRQFAGVIHAWGWYGIYGTAEDCRIVPLRSPVGDAATAACAMVFNKKGTVFRGWIDFRGHPRPFCGTRNGDYPRTCYGEY